MGIKQMQDGTFKVSYHKRHPINGKPMSLKRRNIKSKAMAERTHRELIAEMTRMIDRSIVPTWPKLLAEYERYLPETGIYNSTIYNRISVLNHNTQDSWRDVLITEISTNEIHRLLAEKFVGKSEAHKKYFVNSLRSVFEFAVSRNYINRNPTPLLKFKICSKIKNGLNETQIIHLLRRAQECEWEWYPHYAMALYTGMRNGELYALRWDKVNLDMRKIVVDTAWSSKDGFKSTKSGDDRVIEIPNPLMPVLQQLKLQAGGGIFVLPRMTKWDKGDQARELRFFLKSIGLPEIRFHDLRASWATWLLSKGVAPSKVMSMGGWKDMDTMMIYMRKAGIDIQGATSVLDGIQTHGITEAKVVNLHPM